MGIETETEGPNGKLAAIVGNVRYPYLCRGDIFVSDSGDRVIKLLRRDWENRRRHEFRCQVRAYEIASSHSVLRRHIPEFFGTTKVSDVIAADGSSVANQYLLDCCYVMGRIAGEAQKLSEWRRWERPEHISELLQEFEDAGIGYCSDASLFSRCDRDHVVFIDFATEQSPPILN